MVRSGYYSRLRLDDADGGRNETDFVGVGGKSEVDKQFLGVVPLMRCVEGFICQFGLRGGASELFSRKIPDDPNWLPQGRTPQARRNALGVKRFMKGYVAYAGSGPNSRGRQIFVSLADQSGLGSAPWEVPFAELVGPESYRTLDNMYTGYGEDGPSQESLLTDAGLEDARSQFPELDWIVSCDVVDEETY
jgi:cyclophilin family peptidyl-prolyl cis-trans isomerase